MRLVGEEESLSIVPAVYEVMRTVTPGAISRTEPWWQTGPLGDPEYSRRGASHKFRVVFEADGVAEGYAVYRIKDDWDHRGPKSVLEVKEAVTTTPRALRGLWRYLFEVDLVRTVKAFRQPVPNPLQQILLEPRALGLVANDGLWVRLVDLPGALQARRYATADALVLQVADAFCPWNAGTWRIETTGEPWAAEARVGRADRRARPRPRHDRPGGHLPGWRPAGRPGCGRAHRGAHARRPAPRHGHVRRRAHALVRLDVLGRAGRPGRHRGITALGELPPAALDRGEVDVRSIGRGWR